MLSDAEAGKAYSERAISSASSTSWMEAPCITHHTNIRFCSRQLGSCALTISQGVALEASR